VGKEAEETEKRVQAFFEAFRVHGIRATPQRVEIYRELRKTEEHPDAETVYRRVRERMPVISLDTVYRTLRLFEEKEVISRVGALNERARFDGNMTPHHHFICKVCGFIGDVYCGVWNDLKPPKEVERLGKVHSVHVELRGVCEKCRSR
jgi:Fur family peroxide stress response transcriptional regulator